MDDCTGEVFYFLSLLVKTQVFT